MITDPILVPGDSGKPPLTGRRQGSPLAPSGETGRMFADEVERALERNRGSAVRARQLDERTSARQEARREGFGGVRPREDDGRVMEAHFRSEQGPIEARPALEGPAQAMPRPSTPPAPSPEPAPRILSTQGEPAGGAPAVPAAAPSAPPVPSPQAATPASGVARPQPAPEGAPARSAAPGETRPADLALSSRTRVAAGATPEPTASAGDTAVLERAEEIVRQIRLHLSSSVRRLTLDLQPAELGRLSVQLALRSGKITAIVRAESEETLELLKEKEGDLLGAFAQRGIRADSLRFEHGFGGSNRRGANTQVSVWSQERPSSRVNEAQVDFQA